MVYQYIEKCMYTRRKMIRLRRQREFPMGFSSKSIKYIKSRVPREATLLNGNLMIGLNTTGIFSTDKVYPTAMW